MATQSMVNDLIHRLDDAVSASDDATRCRNVKKVLEDIVTSGGAFVPEALLEPVRDRYARRLLHRDPQGRYTVLVMVWGVGQQTPLHDHAGIWCVECVYRGVIAVSSYSVRGGDPEKDRVKFEREKVVRAGPGEAGALIPPFEYHVIANPTDQSAVTIHVYGGEMTHCHIFEPMDDGTFLRKYKELAYTT
jgi:3-mercaptopropionate dioxygenase